MRAARRPPSSSGSTPSTITDAVSRRLHLQSNHPISITRQLIESRFPGFQFHNELFPVVSVQQNFDSLGFPADRLHEAVTLTPSCGLAGATPGYARRAMTSVREAARYLLPE